MLFRSSAIDELTVNNIMFLAPGNMCLTITKGTYCMYFDKVLAANYDLPNLYEVVNEGKWTIDYLGELVKNVYTDLDADNIRDAEDFYGFYTSTQSPTTAYTAAFEMPIVSINDEYDVELLFNCEKNQNIIDKLHELTTNNSVVLSKLEYDDSEYDVFKAGRAIFTNRTFNYAATTLRAYDNEYGIIPYPKWNENQEEYRTMVDGGHSILAIPVTVTPKDLEFVGAVTEVLCAESWKYVIPEYYDVVVKVKGPRDQESLEMLDLISNSQSFDFGFIYDGWEGYGFSLEVILRSNSTNLSAWDAKNKNSKLNYYRSVVKAFETYENEF